MIAAWMLYSMLVGVLIGAAAHAADRFCRLVRVPVRGVWIVAIAGIVALSMLSIGRLMYPAASDASEIPFIEATATFAGDAAPLTPRWELRSAVSDALNDVYALVAAADVTRMVIMIWLAVSAALLLVLTLTMRQVRHARRAWRRHRIGEIGVLVSPDEGPALIGLRRPAIVVPSWLLAEPADSQRLVVQHEDQHRRAGDHVVLACAFGIVSLMPWNVALWWMLRRLRLAIELDCDARVLRAGAIPRAYGTLLLTIAGRLPARPFGAPALADTSTHLERRIIAMTENHRRQRMRAAATMAPAVLLVAAACATELPTAAEIDEMDVEDVRTTVEAAGVLTKVDGSDPVYVIDGVVVSEDDARLLLPDEIASIDVLKGEAASLYLAEGVIRIRTKAADRREAATAQTLRLEPVEEVRVTPLGIPMEEIEASATRRLRVQEAAIEALPNRSGEPLIYIDGVRVREAAIEATPGVSGKPLIFIDGVLMDEWFELRDLSPESIERIEVLKGEAARLRYDDDRVSNGVIHITTKSGGSR